MSNSRKLLENQCAALPIELVAAKCVDYLVRPHNGEETARTEGYCQYKITGEVTLKNRLHTSPGNHWAWPRDLWSIATEDLKAILSKCTQKIEWVNRLELVEEEIES